jgi:hypothetical protein
VMTTIIQDKRVQIKSILRVAMRGKSLIPEIPSEVGSKEIAPTENT